MGGWGYVRKGERGGRGRRGEKRDGCVNAGPRFDTGVTMSISQ